MGGEIMENTYDYKVGEFLTYLEAVNTSTIDTQGVVEEIICKYKEHFKGFGIYD